MQHTRLSGEYFIFHPLPQVTRLPGYHSLSLAGQHQPDPKAPEPSFSAHKFFTDEQRERVRDENPGLSSFTSEDSG